ncbi:hypothetical protein FVE85_1031 [Porphyridium purpureum]|uniref:39S ribosomal protein L50, mitochondrial n=1 Tax=Porphyridium purpureum TaxID=35688 RepID=A0A5J4Z2D1_PORPP|nr:hypothetical protein FVE85_1031 [Porphyridium purpureum]|eukprot:POR9785..scf208_2
MRWLCGVTVARRGLCAAVQNAGTGTGGSDSIRDFLKQVNVTRSVLTPPEKIGMTSSEVMEIVESTSAIGGDKRMDPDWAAQPLKTVAERLQVSRFFVKEFGTPIPSNVFPMLKCVADYAAFVERALAPEVVPLVELKRPDLPPNLHLDPRTHTPAKVMTEWRHRLKLNKRNREGSFKYMEKLHEAKEAAWNSDGKGPNDPDTQKLPYPNQQPTWRRL